MPLEQPQATLMAAATVEVATEEEEEAEPRMGKQLSFISSHGVANVSFSV